MIKTNQYSTIRSEPKNKPQDGYSWSGFYDGILKPSTLLLTIGGYLVLVQKDDLPTQFELATGGNTSALMHVVLIALSVIIGARLVQSLYLAKRDYLHLESSFLDVITFGTLLLFTTGAVVTFVGKSLTVLIVYAVAAFVGTVHFYSLYRFRIPKNSDAFDYPIERKIQIFNTLTFAYLTVVTAYAAWHVYHNSPPSVLSCIVLASGSLPVLLNILHSDQLTLLPKFLFKNDPDAPKNQVEFFRSTFWQSSNGQSDKEIERLLSLSEARPFQNIKTVRANEDDVSRLSSSLLDEFPYVFGYVFGTRDRKTLGIALQHVLSVAGGLGSLGYMNFYFLINGEDEVGFIALETYHNCVVYRLAEAVLLPYRMFRLFGWGALRGIRERALTIQRLQSDPERGEIRLTYLVIFPSYRRKGDGAAALNMLVGALFRSFTNDIFADKLTLFVRERNDVAVRLFSKIGFKQVGIAKSVEDPFADIEHIGRSLKLEYKAKK